MFFAYGAQIDAIVIMLSSPESFCGIRNRWSMVIGPVTFRTVFFCCIFYVSVKPKVTVLYSHIER